MHASPAASTTEISFAYASCTGHSDCGTNQFCGVKCWTGGCDESNSDRKGKTLDRFCQPCEMCTRYTASATHSCDICKGSGKAETPAMRCMRLGPVRKFAHLKLSHVNMTHVVQSLARMLIRMRSTFDADQSNAAITKSPDLYLSCTAHSDCRANQFCAVRCWTGGCGKDGKVREGKRQQFCQPCTKCRKPADSATHSCDSCVTPGICRAA